MPSHIVPYFFGIADGATAAAGASLPLSGLPDVADSFQYAIVKPGKIVAVEVSSGPASGDGITINPTIGGAAAGPQVTSTNAIKNASTWVGPNDAYTINPQDVPVMLGAIYTTATGTTFGVRDVAAVVYVQYDDD